MAGITEAQKLLKSLAKGRARSPADSEAMHRLAKAILVQLRIIEFCPRRSNPRRLERFGSLELLLAFGQQFHANGNDALVYHPDPHSLRAIAKMFNRLGILRTIRHLKNLVTSQVQSEGEFEITNSKHASFGVFRVRLARLVSHTVCLVAITETQRMGDSSFASSAKMSDTRRPWPKFPLIVSILLWLLGRKRSFGSFPFSRAWSYEILRVWTRTITSIDGFFPGRHDFGHCGGP